MTLKILGGVLALSVFSSCSKPADSTKATAEEMTALNDKLVDAYEREDVDMLKGLLTDNHIHNNVFGSRMTKDEFLEDIESGILEFISYKTPEIEWFIDGELAVATGVIHAEAKRDGKPVPANTFRFTRVYKLVDGEWKVLLFQNTLVPGTSN